MRIPKSVVNVAFACTLCAVLLSLGSVAAQAEVIEGGVLDWIELSGKLPESPTVVVEVFDTADADLGTGAEGGKPKRVEIARQMQAEGPELLVTALIEELTSRGITAVRGSEGGAADANAVVVRGAFTELNPGSKAKRYFAGFGAGKGSIEVEGQIDLPGGETVARFRQRRLTVMGVAGGDYEKKMTKDCRNIGEDIAKFLDKWSRGEELD